MDELQAREHVQGAIDAGETHSRAALAQPVVDVLGAEAAVLPREQAEDLLARAAGPVSGAGDLAVRVVAPLGAGNSHGPDGSAKR